MPRSRTTTGRTRRLVVGSLFLSLLASPAVAQQAVQLDWRPGPMVAPIAGALAEIDLGEGFVYLGKQDTARLLELMQNPVAGNEVATVAPASDAENWFLFFEWDEIGWVDDSEQDELEAAKLLESIRAGTEAANQERRKRGWATLDIVGWSEQPHYDARTNNLTWAIEGTSGGERIINRNIKLLGRRGVMTVTLVSDPTELARASRTADRLLAGYRFKPGNRYAEFIPGTDKVAQFGLAALVVGGAGAALLKSGLLARFWKVIVVGVLGLAAGVRRIVFGPKHIQDPPSSA